MTQQPTLQGFLAFCEEQGERTYDYFDALASRIREELERV